MDTSNVDHPQVSLNPHIYNANWLDLHCMPNLSGHPEIHMCYFNNNEIRIVSPEFLPPNIKEVNFYNNALHTDSLPPRWGNTLEIIVLDRNQITNTDAVAEWSTSLQTLSIDDNPLSEVPQRLPPNLSLLSMSYCKLTTLVNLPPQLKQLRAYYNTIRKIERLPQTLEYAHLGYNSIQSSCLLKYTLPPSLRFLNLDYNKLTSLPTKLPDTLEVLSVVGNMLTALPKELPSSLKTLIVNANRIRTFKPSWKPGQRLFQLHVRNNCITDNLLVLKARGLVEDIFQANNWNQATHHLHALTIQRCFLHYKFRNAIRAWSRLARIQTELIQVSYAPEIVMKCHDVETVQKGLW
jgi:Leucine-rich repeat (LRR) protein